MRDDVAEALDGHEPERYLDNERYGFITRRTYDDLTYASYQYTVRGFDQFVTFRTFLDGYGILTSVDRGHNHDFAALYDTLCASELDFDSLVIGRCDNDSSGSHVTADD